jgi:hypothetical protein
MPSKRKSSACVDYVPALWYKGLRKSKVFLLPFGDASQLHEEHAMILWPFTCSHRSVYIDLWFTDYVEAEIGRIRIYPSQSYSRSYLAADKEKCCTHRPSLLPIEWLSEALGQAQRGRQRPLRAGNLVKLGHLEEVKVVTRFFLPG